MSSLEAKVEGEGLAATITLNDGNKIPLFGLGFFLAEPEQTVNAAIVALQNGYRLLDTAVMYGNEKEVGEGIKKSGIRREDIFVTTKVLPDADHHGYNQAIQSVKECLVKLDLSYIDLILIHTPIPGNLLATYDGLLKMKEEELVRSVGVSNFGVHHLEEFQKAGRPTPAVNQIELNCYWRLENIVKYCQEHGIAVEGYSPLFRSQKKDDPLLVEMAKRYKKSVAQLLLRWSVQKQYITIPKSANPGRILENAQVFDFNINDENMHQLDNLPSERCAFAGKECPTTCPWLG